MVKNLFLLWLFIRTGHKRSRCILQSWRGSPCAAAAMPKRTVTLKVNYFLFQSVIADLSFPCEWFHFSIFKFGDRTCQNSCLASEQCRDWTKTGHVVQTSDFDWTISSSARQLLFYPVQQSSLDYSYIPC